MTLDRIRRGAAILTARVNPAPIFILGNQKSGTSAITFLLGELTGSTVTNDLRREIGDQLIPEIRRGRASVQRLVRRNRLDFTRDIIKHPNLTLIYDELTRAFPRSRFVFVVRDPRDNIRSILDRLDLPGSSDQVLPAQRHRLSPAWQAILDGEVLGMEGESYVSVLAHRWNLMVDVYLGDLGAFVLIRYEDFMADKLGALGELAESLDLPITSELAADRLDRQYQPRGRNRGTTRRDFFGPNLDLIERLCAARMAAFGYSAGDP